MELYYNCHVYGNDGDCFVVDGNKFSYVGYLRDLKDIPDNKIDLKDKYVYPGFIDSHMHVVNYGKFLQNVSLYEHTSSLQEMLTELSKYKDRRYIIARGFNHDYFKDAKRYPNRQDLDSISKDIPIVITRACGHLSIANSKAIELSGIKESSNDIDLENGYFKENSVYLLYEGLPKVSKEDIKKYILNAQKKMNEYGITSCHSDDFLSATNNYKDALNALEELNEEHKLTVRIYEQAQFLNLDEFKDFIQAGYYTGKGDNYFKIGPLKIIGDGSLGARTALLSCPYKDDSSTKGMQVCATSKLYELMDYADSRKFQIAIHAIGDGILDIILNKYQEFKCKEKRHGVVHCQITRADQLEKFKKLGIHAYIQSIFLDYDNKIVEKRVREDIASTSYSFKTLFDYVKASNGSDCPVEFCDCLKGMQLAITRTSINDHKPFNPNEALSAKEAIDSFTINGAYASFEENIKGKIKKGMLADFVVLEESIEEKDPYSIKDIQILKTYMDGKEVFSKL